MSSTDERSSTDGVPSPGDPDRKRVLNVLAQRRYSMVLSCSTFQKQSSLHRSCQSLASLSSITLFSIFRMIKAT
jgi:hypothetical protein